MLVLKVILRNLWKRKFLSFAKIFGLVVGFTIFIFLFELIAFEKSYDAFWTDTENIYRVALDLTYEDGKEVKSAKNFNGSSELLHTELSNVVAQCNFGKDVITVFNGPQQKIQDVNFVWSDPSFFEVFDRKIISTETTSLLENIHGVVISESLAKKLFGNDSALNREITVNEGWKYNIDGVFEDIPGNSHMKIDMVGTYKTLFYYMGNFDNQNQVLVDNDEYQYLPPTPYEENRWRTPIEYRPYSYIKLADGVKINDVASKVDGLLEKVALPQVLKDADMKFIFQPLADIHLNSKLDHELSVSGDRRQVLFYNILIAVVLMVCLMNFINLNTITTIESLKTYTIRILNGSRYIQIFYLMLLESFVLNFFAITLSLYLANTLVSSLIPEGSISITTLGALFTLAMVLTFVASFMPFVSFVKEGVFSISTRIGQRINQKWASQKIMVIVQFSITIVLIICTVGVFQQMNFMMRQNLGFNGQQTIYSFTPMTMNQHPDIPTKLTTFKNEVMALGNVNSFSVSSSIPGKPINRLNNQIKEIEEPEPYASTFSEMSIDDKYIDAYQIHLIAGDDLIPNNNWNSDKVLINRFASEEMGFDLPSTAVNKMIAIGNMKYQIQGVIENYHHTSLHHKIKPTIYYQNLNWDHGVGYYSIQLNTNDISSTLSEIGRIWNQLYPKEEFLHQFSNEAFQIQYERDQKFNKVLSYSTVLALLVSCIGLLGVALFNTKKRIKEIGIRKVNGAKVNEILIMLNKDFIKWVVIAFILACPIAYFTLAKWLENFAYKTNLSWWVYATAGVLAFVIALLTVSWQSYKAATNNPVNALRND